MANPSIERADGQNGAYNSSQKLTDSGYYDRDPKTDMRPISTPPVARGADIYSGAINDSALSAGGHSEGNGLHDQAIRLLSGPAGDAEEKVDRSKGHKKSAAGQAEDRAKSDPPRTGPNDLLKPEQGPHRELTPAIIGAQPEWAGRSSFLPYAEGQWLYHNMRAHDAAPTDQEKTDASKVLNDGLGPLLDKDVKQSISNIQDALIRGDKKALSDEVQKYKGDPEKLAAVAAAIEANLRENRAAVHVTAKDGKLVIYGGNNRAQGISFDSNSADVSVVSMQSTWASATSTPGDVVPNKTPDAPLKALGEYAAVDILFNKNYVPEPNPYGPDVKF